MTPLAGPPDGGYTLRSRLLATMLGTVLVTTTLVGGLAYGTARAIVVGEAERAVDIVADARKEALLRRLRTRQERARGFLGQLEAVPEGAGTGAMRGRLLASYLATEGATAARCELEGAAALALGPPAQLEAIARDLAPNANQLALFYRDQSAPYFLIHADSPRGGALTLRFPIESVALIFSSFRGLGEAGETFLADSHGHFLTPSRYAGLGTRVVAKPMAMCLAGMDGEVTDPDYRGVDTVMSFRYVREIGGGAIMAHMSRAEAFEPLDSLARRLLGGVALLLLLGAGAAVALARALGRPIERLQARVLALRAGDFASPVELEGPSEVRTVARAFTELARSVEAHQQELEARVDERTTALAARTEELQQVNLALVEQRHFTEGLLQHLPAGVAYFDAELRFKAVNQAYLRQFGFGESVLGLHFAEAFGGADGLALELKLRQLLETGQSQVELDFPFSYTYEGEVHEGRWDVIRTPMVDSRGKPAGVLVLAQDVTQRWRLMRELDRRTTELSRQKAMTEHIIAHAPVVMAYIDQDLVYRWNNPLHSQLVGLPPEQILGRTVAEVLPPALHGQTLPLYEQVLASGEPYRVTAVPARLRPDGTVTYLDIGYVPVEGEGQGRLGILVFATDVSERVEKERLQAEQIEQLRHVDQMKDRFFGILSHELRTPLNAVLGFASVLDDQVLGPLTPEQHHYLGKILGGTEVLLALINDLLDMSRIQAGKFSLSPVPMHFEAIAREAMSNLAALAERKDERLINEVPDNLPPLVADPQRLGQVLVNLVGNAIKFTPPGGTIRLQARVDGEQLYVAVLDTGIGIAAADQARLFMPFTQLDSGNARSASGTGLGLSITKALVEAHGGSVGVESAPGAGSTFWFSLPLGLERSPDSQQPASSSVETSST